eukprot:5041952-Pleurochrysis_carterae.AAC.1
MKLESTTSVRVLFLSRFPSRCRLLCPSFAFFRRRRAHFVSREAWKRRTYRRNLTLDLYFSWHCWLVEVLAGDLTNTLSTLPVFDARNRDAFLHAKSTEFPRCDAQCDRERNGTRAHVTCWSCSVLRAGE